MIDGSVYRTGIAITGNTLRNVTQYGIYVDAQSANADGISITGNVVYNTGSYGVWLRSASSTRTTHVTVAGNTITRLGATGYGIYFSLGRNITVSGNTIDGESSGRYGIVSHGSSHSTISGNSVFRVGTSSSSWNSGIYVVAYGSTLGFYNNISGNRIGWDSTSPNLNYGIRISNSRYTLITGNSAINPGSITGLYIDAASAYYTRAPACSNLFNGDVPSSCP